ncbi:MAG: DoxX family membrane protein [Candidatus Yanofskybacteria bacterium]|nr:DoxX family membrane protein [Candidatus Yanofskybacteria bacterium]
MMEFLSAYTGLGSIVLSVVLGVVFVVHGWPKLRNPGGIASALGLPKVAGLLHGFVEFAGGIVLVLSPFIYLGQLFDWSAILLAVIMVGATYFKAVRWQIGFNGGNKMGWEFDVVILGGLLALLLG